MAELKTQRTNASVSAFLNAVEDEAKRADAKMLAKLFTEVTGEKPAMWGPSIIGYGQYTYTYISGHGGTWPITGFSPRKANLTLYIMPGFDDYGAQLARLGKHKIAKSCLYIKRLPDVDEAVLRDIIGRGFAAMRAKYG